MIALLALRNFLFRPWRSVLLFLGYGIGVGVMIVLLAIGQALITQASDEKLIGGGQITVLPEGLDIEVMKTGGIGGLFFSIANSRFIYRQLLASPRLRASVSAVSPQIDGKLLYLRKRGGGEWAVRATGEIPDATRAVGAAPPLAAGNWSDDDGDRRYTSPTPAELRNEIDHFHMPPDSVRDASSWAEWHYFNVLSPDGKRWAFISLILAGDPRGKQWGGRVAITLREQGGATRRFASTVPRSEIRFSTTAADLTLGASTVRVLPDGRYAVRARASEEGTGRDTVSVDLIVSPAPGAYFPGTALGSADFVSGYTVPALRASASGSICVRNQRARSQCERYDSAQAYHDHNWGVWRGVTWDWGAARAGSYTLLYGRVYPPDSLGSAPPLLVYLVDSLGFRAVFRPARVTYSDTRTISIGGQPVRVPGRASFADVRGDDTLRVTLEVEDAIGTDMRGPPAERGGRAVENRAARPYFIQMKGIARITGRVQGAPLSGTGRGFFETYR